MIEQILDSYRKELLLEFEYGVQSPMTIRERELYRAYKKLNQQAEELRKALAEVIYESQWGDAENALCKVVITARQALQSMKGGEEK